MAVLAVPARRAVNVEDLTWRTIVSSRGHRASVVTQESLPPSARVIHVALGARSC